MKKFVWVWLVLLLLWSNSHAGFHWITDAVPDGDLLAKKLFTLVEPVDRAIVTGKAVLFKWIDEVRGSEPRPISHYELKIWDHRYSVMREIPVNPDNEGRTVEFLFHDFRDVIKKCGSYLWKVSAVYANGSRRITRFGVFEVREPKHQVESDFQESPYEVQFRTNLRDGGAGFQNFIQNLNPQTHMKSYSDIALVFHQRNILSSQLEFEEKFFLQSHMGIGAGFALRFCALRTEYCGIYPQSSIETSWFGTGLKNYTSNMIDVRVGAKLTFCPGGYLSIKVEYIPSYRVRYSQYDGSLRTFQGRGWNWGIRWIIPERILPPFNIMGVKIDFRRIALTYNEANIKDGFTGTSMKLRTIGVNYLLW